MNKTRTATIYNVEIERRLITEHNFEKAIYNLSKLARLKEITTVEIVLDTIQQSIEVSLRHAPYRNCIYLTSRSWPYTGAKWNLP